MNAREFCRRILGSPEYRESVRRRALAGTLPGDVEAVLWALALGPVPDYARFMDPADDGAPLPKPTEASMREHGHEWPHEEHEEFELPAGAGPAARVLAFPGAAR